MDVELAHEMFAMGFHGADADAEAGRDFFVAPAFGDLHEHFALAFGQAGRIGGRVGAVELI